MSKFQTIIGRSEYVDIVGIALGVPAKIDTGAFRSSIHAIDIKLHKRAEQEILSCKLLGHPCSPVPRPFETTDFSKVLVMNSFGEEEERFEVQIKVKLGPKIFKTSFTLADRVNNLFPILVGRKFLKARYIVDVNRSSLDRVKLKKSFGVSASNDAEDLED